MLHDNMLDTIIAFDAYELGAMNGCVIRAWTFDMACEIKQLRAQLAAEASAVEVLGKVKKAITDQGLELVEEGGEYRLEFQQVASISFNTDLLKLLSEAEQQAKENQ